MASILDKLKQRQALAVARAPKPALHLVGRFEDILAQAAAQNARAAFQGPAAAAGGGGEGGGDGGRQAAAAEGAEAAEGAGGGEEMDLEILSSDAEEAEGAEVNERVVELPSTMKKKRFALSFPSQVGAGGVGAHRRGPWYLHLLGCALAPAPAPVAPVTASAVQACPVDSLTRILPTAPVGGRRWSLRTRC